LQLLPFGEPFKASAFDCADVYEHILSAAVLLNKAEALLDVEKLHRPLASADDLGRHAAETTATAATRAAGTTRAAAEAAATAAGATAAAAVAITATAAAKPVAAATEAVTAKIARGRETVIPAAKRIEAIFTETVALVASAPASPIVTHRSVCTLPHCPLSIAPMSWTVSRTGHRRAEFLIRCARVCDIAHKRLLCERNYRLAAGVHCQPFRECLCEAAHLGMTGATPTLESRTNHERFSPAYRKYAC
jgi:hypothetical protein